MPRSVEGYFKKKKNDKKVMVFNKYTKRYFILDTQGGFISYAPDKGKKATAHIMI